jgi:hypothetical protein
MGKIADATFSEASGTKYSFGVYTLDTGFKNIGAVYIYTKRTVNEGKGTHEFLYIGETEELANRLSGHEKLPCVYRHGVNCICVHVEENENTRLKIETDLRHANDTPCNDQ